jgi:hypothetical protein
MVQLGITGLENLARMICGDAPYSFMPFRSPYYVGRFFQDIGFDYPHDGNSRYSWAFAILEKLNARPPAGPNMPSAEMIKVIEFLLYPGHFVSKSGKPGEKTHWDRPKGLAKLNELLRTYSLEVRIDSTNDLARLISISAAGKPAGPAVIASAGTVIPGVAQFIIPQLPVDNKLVAILMPASKDLLPVYDTLKNCCGQLGFFVCRAPPLWQASTNPQDIFDLIFASHFVISDLTHRDPNVLYQVGLAHTLGKIVVPITQSYDDLPFPDMKPISPIKYPFSLDGMTELERALLQRLKQAFKDLKEAA